jgi:hypothetical protein
MFEAGLEEGVKAWRQAGCASAWIDGGVEAARAAYRAALPGEAKLPHSLSHEYWEDRAGEVRTIADSALDYKVKRILGEIADGYDRLAEMAKKQRQKKSSWQSVIVDTWQRRDRGLRDRVAMFR